MRTAEKVRCDVTGYSFSAVAVRECPEPNVIARYGSGGVAHVCVYVCRKCRNAVRYPFFGGLSCALDPTYQQYLQKKNRPRTGDSGKTKRGDYQLER